MLTIKLITTLCLLLISIFTLAASPVFKIEKDNHLSYLAGTVHLLTAQDHPLPKAMNAAFDAADVVVFETDIPATQTPAFQQKLMQAISLTPPTTIENTLKPETYKTLLDFMGNNGLSIVQFKQLSASGLSLMLSVIEMSKLGNSPALGVEQTYMQKLNGKVVKALETPEEQIAFIANLGKGQEDTIILKTIADMATLKTQLMDLKTHWRAGDFDKLDDAASQEMRADFPEIYQSLVVDRNNNWLPKIQSIHQQTGTAIFMVGALHLAGEDSVIELLKKSGFKITQL